MRGTIALVCLLAACGPQGSSSGDDQPGDDAPEADARPGEGIDAQPGEGIDAEPGGEIDAASKGGPQDLPVNCVPHMRTLAYSNGSSTEQVYQWALFDEVAPGDDFEVVVCSQVYTPPLETCSAGTTCTGSVYPPGSVCATQRGTGQFYGGMLAVLCGYTVTYFDSGGTQTSQNGMSYETITVTKF